ncbi:YjbQ family protein [Patescibacteria group bacterium]|nr:YjbQ family protein [Patescibacteria group bacterium]
MKVVWEEVEMYSEEYLNVMDFTEKVRSLVVKSKVKEGIVNIFNPHVTCAICVNEDDPDLWQDLLEAYQKIAPVKGNYHHNAKYRGMSREQNAHAHILNTLIGSAVSLPIRQGKLTLGTWQSVLFVELDGGKHRRILVQIMGEE